MRIDQSLQRSPPLYLRKDHPSFVNADVVSGASCCRLRQCSGMSPERNVLTALFKRGRPVGGPSVLWRMTAARLWGWGCLEPCGCLGECLRCIDLVAGVVAGVAEYGVDVVLNGLDRLRLP